MPKNQTSFPLISELPLIQHSKDWIWHRSDVGRDFWIGEDHEGSEWLLKVTGSFRALRERAFSVIAQNLGISCQSSTFLTLSPECEPQRNMQPDGSNQLAIWFILEHEAGCCGDTCPLRSFSKIFEDAHDAVIALRHSSVPNAIDWVRGEILGHLCDMHEPPGRLFTRDHKLVIIDNELTFAKAPADIWECEWLWTVDGEWSEPGLKEVRNVCEAVANLSDDVFANGAIAESW